MCGSVNFQGSGGMGLMSSLVGAFAEQRKQADSYARDMASIEIQKRRLDDEYRRRVVGAIYEMQEAHMAQNQANEAATQSKGEIAREMLRAREEARAAASAAGVGGNTLNRLLTDISFTEQQKLAVADTNRNNIVAAQQMQKHKAIENSKVNPFYYTTPSKGGGFLNSMISVVPALFSGFSFGSVGCAPSTTRQSTTCRVGGQ